MANLTQILAETNKSYDNSRNALNNQINAIGGQLQAQKDRINAQYAQQQQNLNNQRNWQAQADSMRAAGSGGSFGGSANIANKRYYQQAFIPAQTQMQTNQSNDLSSAESQANANRLSLQNALARLNDEATRFGYQRFDQAQAQERQEALERERMAEQRRQFDAQMAQRRAEQARQNNWMQYLQQGKQAPQNKYGFEQDASGGYRFKNNATNNSVRFGTYVDQFGRDGFNDRAQQMLRSGDADMRWLADYLGGQQVAYTGGGGKNYYNSANIAGSTNKRAADIMNRLGIHMIGSM